MIRRPDQQGAACSGCSSELDTRGGGLHLATRTPFLLPTRDRGVLFVRILCARLILKRSWARMP
jgi:hypothetical protein